MATYFVPDLPYMTQFPREQKNKKRMKKAKLEKPEFVNKEK